MEISLNMDYENAEELKATLKEVVLKYPVIICHEWYNRPAGGHIRYTCLLAATKNTAAYRCTARVNYDPECVTELVRKLLPEIVAEWRADGIYIEPRLICRWQPD